MVSSGEQVILTIGTFVPAVSGCGSKWWLCARGDGGAILCQVTVVIGVAVTPMAG